MYALGLINIELHMKLEVPSFTIPKIRLEPKFSKWIT